MFEIQTMERKREYSQNAQKTMLAFLNTDGGTLYIGIENDGTVYGVDGDVDVIMQGIVSSFRDSVAPDPSGYFKVEPEVRDGEHIIVATMERSSAIPYCYAKYRLVPQGVYVRVANTQSWLLVSIFVK